MRICLPFRGLRFAVALGWASAVLAAPVHESQTRAALTLLKAECLSCHGEQKTKGGLSLLTRDTLLKGGDDGPVVAPGRPDESRLVTVLQEGADPHMPPRKQLDQSQVGTIRDFDGRTDDLLILGPHADPAGRG